MIAATSPYEQAAAAARRQELIVQTLPLVRHIVGRITARLPQGVDVENLESAGTLGLVEAAGKFDPDRGVKFETYAYTRIRGAVLDELRRNCPLPQHMLERVERVRKVYAELPPGSTDEALAAAAGISREELADCLAAMHLAHMIAGQSAEGALDAAVDHSAERPDVLAEQAEQKAVLAEAIQSLSPRERTVLVLYYMEELRLKEIGVVLRLSESRVSRLLSAAVFNVGEYVRLRGI